MKKQNISETTQKWPNRLVLVRHGQSIYNEERELVNRGVLKTYATNVKDVRNADLSLSNKGKKQAEKTARFLKKNYAHFDLIFASPFKRAYDTARIIARRFPDAKFIIQERIREKEFGIIDGFTADEVKTLFPYEYKRKQKEKKYYYRPAGGESYPDLNLRIWSFLTTLVREHSKTNVLVVSHSAVMLSFRKLLEKINEKNLMRIDKKDDLKNCGIISYRFSPRIKPKPRLKLEIYNKIAW